MDIPSGSQSNGFCLWRHPSLSRHEKQQILTAKHQHRPVSGEKQSLRRTSPRMARWQRAHVRVPAAPRHKHPTCLNSSDRLDEVTREFAAAEHPSASPRRRSLTRDSLEVAFAAGRPRHTRLLRDNQRQVMISHNPRSTQLRSYRIRMFCQFKSSSDYATSEDTSFYWQMALPVRYALGFASLRRAQRPPTIHLNRIPCRRVSQLLLRSKS